MTTIDAEHERGSLLRPDENQKTATRTNDNRMPGVYLAGPAVFAPGETVADYFRQAAQLCGALGLQALSPLDIELRANAFDQRPESRAAAIKRGNLELLMAANCIVADISPFRGPHLDPGTAYEIGYADALGLPVILYSTVQGSLLRRMKTAVDAEGYSVEDFGLCDNLMIAAALSGSNTATAGRPVHASLGEALAAAAAIVRA